MNHNAELRRIAAALALTALAACSGGAHSSIPSTAPATGGGLTATSPTSQLVSRLSPSASFTAGTTLIGPASSVDSVVLHVVPNLQNAAGLTMLAQQVSDPSSGNYRQFIGPADIGSRFGATAGDYAAVANYFASYGLKVGGWPQRLALTVAGPRTAVEKAIGTTLAFYLGKNGHTVLAPNGTVTFSKAIPVSSIANAVIDPKAPWVNSVAGGPTQALLSGEGPQQIAAAFDYDSAYNAGFTGRGITIGIVGTGPAMAADFNAFKAEYGWSGASTLTFPPVNAVAASNANGSPTGTPPAVTGPCGTSSNPNYDPSESPSVGCNPEDFEAQIDTEQAALARDATIAFYLAYVPVECATPGSASCSPDPATGLGYAYQGLAESDDEIQQMIADNTVDIVSGSYGGPEVLTNEGYIANAYNGYDPAGLGSSEMAALAVEGIAAFFASGDQGAQTCAPYIGGATGNLQCVSYPASDINVTAVGGVTAPLNNAGTFVGPITGWGQQTFGPGGGGASGGGVSCYFPTPSWQVQPSFETGSLLSAASTPVCGLVGGPNGGRVLPDISLEGDPATGVATIANVAFGGATQSVFGGTSVATPEMAAMWALVLQACSQNPSCATASGAKSYRLGNAAPILWRKIYQSQSLYDSSIYDVSFGNNGLITCAVQGGCPNPPPTPAPGYAAGAGWDAVTGLGVPFARHLITAVAGI